MRAKILIINIFLVLIISTLQSSCSRDEIPPDVAISFPLDMANITESITIKVSATDNESIEGVDFYVDHVLLGSDKIWPYEYYWNVSFWADSSEHKIFARATDEEGNSSEFDSVSVFVSEQSAISPVLSNPEDSTLFSDASNITLNWHSLEGAINYEVVLAKAPNFTQAINIISVADTSVDINDLDDGTYSWKVRGINSSDLKSEWSDSSKFFIRFITFIKSFEAGLIDIGNSIQPTQDRGYIVVGHGSRTYPVLLLKLREDGTQEWRRSFSITGDDVGYFGRQTTDGGYIIVGATTSAGRTIDTPGNVLVIKTDNAGIEEWKYIFGGTLNDLGSSIIETMDGGYILTGFTHSFSKGDKDLLIIKLDSNGSQQWFKTFGGPSTDIGNEIIQTNDGGFIISGMTYLNDQAGWEVWLIKINNNGSLEWERFYGQGFIDEGRSIDLTSDGGYIIAGTTRGQNIDFDDGYLLKIDSQGNQEWSNTFKIGGQNFLYSVKETMDGGYIVAGHSSVSDGGGILLIKVGTSGIVEWNRTYGGDFRDIGRSVIQARDGGYVISGATRTFSNSFLPDVVIIKTDDIGQVFY